MKNLKVLLVAVLMLGLCSLAFADADPAEDEIISGTVPFNTQWAFNDSTTANGAAFNDVLIAVYEADLLTIPGVQVCNNLDANDSLYVSAKVGSWTKPADYPASGNKNSVTANSDFKIKVASNSDSLAIVSPFSTKNLLTSTDQEILITNSVGGIEGATFTLDADVLWDWTKDIATNSATDYSITMTLTVAQIIDGAK